MHEVLNYYSIGYLIRVHWPKVVEMQQRIKKKKGYWSSDGKQPKHVWKRIWKYNYK